MYHEFFDDLIAFDCGQLLADRVPVLFQALIDSGYAWQLQGSYGRIALDLIDAGVCTVPEIYDENEDEPNV